MKQRGCLAGTLKNQTEIFHLLATAIKKIFHVDNTDMFQYIQNSRMKCKQMDKIQDREMEIMKRGLIMYILLQVCCFHMNAVNCGRWLTHIGVSVHRLHCMTGL
jgi:hypothetical protein